MLTPQDIAVEVDVWGPDPEKRESGQTLVHGICAGGRGSCRRARTLLATEHARQRNIVHISRYIVPEGNGLRSGQLVRNRRKVSEKHVYGTAKRRKRFAERCFTTPALRC